MFLHSRISAVQNMVHRSYNTETILQQGSHHIIIIIIIIITITLKQKE
jgi:hypothetical protein